MYSNCFLVQFLALVCRGRLRFVLFFVINICVHYSRRWVKSSSLNSESVKAVVIKLCILYYPDNWTVDSDVFWLLVAVKCRCMELFGDSSFSAYNTKKVTANLHRHLPWLPEIFFSLASGESGRRPSASRVGRHNERLAVRKKLFAPARSQ